MSAIELIQAIARVDLDAATEHDCYELRDHLADLDERIDERLAVIWDEVDQ